MAKQQANDIRLLVDTAGCKDVKSRPILGPVRAAYLDDVSENERIDRRVPNQFEDNGDGF